jgi:hypothetical protein
LYLVAFDYIVKKCLTSIIYENEQKVEATLGNHLGKYLFYDLLFGGGRNDRRDQTTPKLWIGLEFVLDDAQLLKLSGLLPLLLGGSI